MILLNNSIPCHHKNNKQLKLNRNWTNFANAKNLRKQAAAIFSPERAAGLRILYGGSVKPDNIKGLMAQVEIDGALVGGASLNAEAFASIVNF